jgi:exodeoxyribonuclease V gamma subunit
MPLNIYTSNRMENLVKALAGIVAQPLASPFIAEEIVVQSKGMQRWLAMELAGHFGVWANCNYPFPNAMVWRLFGIVLEEIPDTSAFSPEVMTWKIMAMLPQFLAREEFAPLRNYLEGDRDGLKRFQLAEKIADSFDQYTLFRPGMLQEWEAGGGEDWQAILWRELAASGNNRHRGQLKQEFMHSIAAKATGIKAIPGRIAVFGISYLPDYHMEILAAMAAVTEVNLFLLSPTREYWSDIIPDKVRVRLALGERALRIEGNPLLASLGKLGRDFSDIVIEVGEGAVTQQDLYGEPEGALLLQSIQADILHLRGVEQEHDKLPIAAGDRSIQIHSCHGPMREIEVLYDNLLDLLDKGDGLEPRDIVVMTPNVELYAPYIATVFEGCQDPAKKIPYSIADRGITSEGRIAAVIVKLLDLPGGRLPVTRVYDILVADPVCRRFGLDENQLAVIRGWLQETRIRWGIDEQDRVRLDLPGYRENSWRSGLDRLLLGYAMPDEGGTLFAGILPFDDMEGADAQTLGKFVEYFERIAELARTLVVPRTLVEWREVLRTMLANFIAADDDSARELATVAGIVEDIGELENSAGFTEQVEFGVIRAWLSARLAKEEKGLGFLTGGVTFCAMLPMRSIPFRVVALIGMNDGDFPRQSRPPGFDLISRNPRRGDRSLRDEDRYLFLESILSARQYFYISYVGQSIKDNSEIPPSVLVSELLDSIGAGYAAEEDSIDKRLVTRHRLQAFSSDYFTGNPALFSYSGENCAALLEKRNNPWQAAGFLDTPLAPPSDQWLEVTLAQLLRFFDNPARYFLENRLGIRLENSAVPLEEREPFAVAGLEAYSLKQELLELCLKGGDSGELFNRACRLGMLPPALHGEMLFSKAVEEVSAFAETIKLETAGMTPLIPLDFELVLGGFRLSGRLDRIWPERMLRYRCTKMKARDQIRVWLEHLVLNASRTEGYPGETRLLMSDGCKSWRPVEDASAILGSVLDLYRQGLMSPLRFFPMSSMGYAYKQEWNLERARHKWQEGFNNLPGEGDDPAFKLCFGETDPFDGEFERVGRTLLEPLLQHQA